MTAAILLLAQSAYQYQPFLKPLPVWDYWYLLLLPLCLGVSIVYKSIKCATMRKVPWEASVIFVMTVGGFVLGAAVLTGLTKLIEWLE